MPSYNTYRLTWVSLTLDVGYLFTAAPAKRSLCSLPWMRGISSQPPLRPSDWLVSCDCGFQSVCLLMEKVKRLMEASTIVWPQVSYREGTHLHPSTENWIKDLLSMAPPIRTVPVSPSVSVSQLEAAGLQKSDMTE